MRVMNWSCVVSTVMLLALSTPASAQRAAGGPPDWPCVQRLVPELSLLSIWRGPPIDELDEEWWSDEEVGRLARFASARATSESDAISRVRDFAQGTGEDREHRLTLLFAGVFERITRERAGNIEAIRRYARGQVRQLEKIGRLVDEMDAARTSEDAERVQRLEQEIFWEKRLFDSRQASLRALCEQPYLLEERLSRLNRVIAEHL